MYLFTPGEATARLTLGPALNFAPDRPVRIAVSMDGEAASNAHRRPARLQRRERQPRLGAIGSRQRPLHHQHAPDRGPGYHTFRVWMVDPGVVLERIVIDTPASAKGPSYLGPPESFAEPSDNTDDVVCNPSQLALQLLAIATRSDRQFLELGFERVEPLRLVAVRGWLWNTITSASDLWKGCLRISERM